MADTLATPQDLAALLQLDYASLSAAQQAAMQLLVEIATAKVQRAAGGQRILEATDKAVLTVAPCHRDPYLALPQQPVQTVSAVEINGTATTDYHLLDGMLWRRCGWNATSDPATVTVTYKHGYAAGSQALELARDVVLSLARLGYGNPGGTIAEAVDDYRVQYAEADARMEMTRYQREALAAAYGAGAYVTGSR